MIRPAYILICLTGMFGFWFALKFLFYGISEDFGLGMTVGFFLAAGLFYAGYLYDKHRGRAQRRN